MKKALIIVDMQKDFCEGGSLAVIGGNSIIPIINKLKIDFLKNGDIVVTSRELHPPKHKSFASTNKKNPFDVDENGNVFWPDHCIKNTVGSQFHDDLDISGVHIFTKGRDLIDHPFSAFVAISDKSDMWLRDFLIENNVDETFIVGLAMEFCVAETAIDSAKLGFKTNLITKATCSLSENAKIDTIEKLKSNNINIL